jgi:Nucleotidyl transferase AbiEii toxin, Type IV TA system
VIVKKQSSHVPASVRQRLLNMSRERHEDFQLLLVRYALERLLYRLSVSEYADQFILKGALLFQLWFDIPQRPTRDADFLGFGEAEPERLAETFRAITQLAAPELTEDGLEYLPDSVRAEPIREAASYPGIRVSLTAQLAGAQIPVQCDIGFGDAVTPAAERMALPVLLQLPAPTLRVYPAETVVKTTGRAEAERSSHGVQHAFQLLTNLAGDQSDLGATDQIKHRVGVHDLDLHTMLVCLPHDDIAR